LFSGKQAGFLSFSPYRVAAAQNIKTILFFIPSQPEVVYMNKLWKEELENKLKNKIYIWDEKHQMWKNILDTNDWMTNSEYESIKYSIALIEDYPLP
jgi:hypothetical protein